MKNLEIIVLKGLPAAGKSTYARKLIADNPNKYKRINKDLLREMFDSGIWSRKNEKFIVKRRNSLIIDILDNGYSVIIDDTNLHPKHLETMYEIANDFGEFSNKKIDVKLKMFDISVDEAIKRDLRRQNPVGAKVIKDMYKRFLAPEIPKIKWVQKLPTAIIVDVDGTLAKMDKRGPFEWDKVGSDKPNLPIVDIIDKYHETVDIIILSGRDGRCKPETVEWLEENGIQYKHFFMRDPDNNEKDCIIKRRIYEEKIKPYYNVLFVLDDRNQVVDMWRSLGLTCLQVAPGDF